MNYIRKLKLNKNVAIQISALSQEPSGLGSHILQKEQNTKCLESIMSKVFNYHAYMHLSISQRKPTIDRSSHEPNVLNYYY